MSSIVVTIVVTIVVKNARLRPINNDQRKKNEVSWFVLLVRCLSMCSISALTRVRSVWLDFSDSLPLSGSRVAAQSNNIHFMRFSTTGVYTKLLKPVRMILEDE
jgi:hypothetical protein